jgi:predicted RNA-binding protein YlqC (UPF0109 family)
MESEKLDLIKNETLQLLKQIYKEELILKEAKIDLRGINLIFDCKTKEAKAKILGKQGKHIQLVRKVVKLFGFMNYQANINIFLLPDVERFHKSNSGKNI